MQHLPRPDSNSNQLSPVPEADAMQGDQIGRIFAYWAIVFFGQFYEKYSSSQKVKVIYKFRQKMGWAKLWAIFSQTHLVTLPQTPKGKVVSSECLTGFRFF
jgi:hypothetical protein